MLLVAIPSFQMWVILVSFFFYSYLNLNIYLKIFFLSFFSQDIAGYLRGCRYLPKLNNEIPNATNPIYKQRFTSLQNLVLIMVHFTPLFKNKNKNNLIICLLNYLSHFIFNIFTVWKWWCYNSKRKFLVWLLSRWNLLSNFATTTGNVISLFKFQIRTDGISETTSLSS